ncbi:MAG: UDP-N-acetylmuramoyl-L-alanyl-D-glutamate--2,6-diaminopimelate ligase [Candidatus Levybacteria bacterium]|nr:UDP-N-acetylmuramoyl-L-alanyl-D-glutamate--2,6-diaminopimelate ligase [Candidatus Levybacteria bacterium]
MWQKIKNIYHFFIAVFWNILFLFPARRLKVIGVTGTDGKTTTVNLIYHILKESGKRVSMVSSLGAVIGDKIYPIGFHVTTPQSFLLQKLFFKARRQGAKYFVLEVTSHSLDQERALGVPFEIGVITNLTSEHLDYHKTYDNYVKTKEKLLKKAKIAVVNKDDAAYQLLNQAKSSKDPKDWVTYGFFEGSEINPENFDISNANIFGEFNKYNVLAAVAACKSLGLSDEEIKKALLSFDLPKGRLDFVYRGEFGVMIDFAHTPNAFEQLLKSLRPIIRGKIIHVFGSAGERDTLKRPYMGDISASFADIVILTTEDPRSEDVNKIIEQIESGIDNPKGKILKIVDRKQAITAAIGMAKKNDLVLITGKAAENSMNLGNGEEPWDEYEVVRNILSDLNLKVAI